MTDLEKAEELLETLAYIVSNQPCLLRREREQLNEAYEFLNRNENEQFSKD